MKIKKFNENGDDVFDNYDEDWEEIEETPEYVFLRSLHKFADAKAYPKKGTLRFLKKAKSMILTGDIKKETLDLYIENEDLNKNIIIKFKKTKNSHIRSIINNDDNDDNNRWSDPCGSGSSRQSHC